jgi:hypothetical protein
MLSRYKLSTEKQHLHKNLYTVCKRLKTVKGLLVGSKKLPGAATKGQIEEGELKNNEGRSIV